MISPIAATTSPRSGFALASLQSREIPRAAAPQGGRLFSQRRRFQGRGAGGVLPLTPLQSREIPRGGGAEGGPCFPQPPVFGGGGGGGGGVGGGGPLPP